MFNSPKEIIIDWLTLPEANNLKSELAKCNEITYGFSSEGKCIVIKCDEEHVLIQILEAEKGLQHEDLWYEEFVEFSLQNNEGEVQFRLPNDKSMYRP